MNRKSLLFALCLLGGSTLIAVGWWDHWNPNQINQWWAGERLYPFYWHRLGLTLAVVLPVALLAWWLRGAVRPAPEDTSLAQSRRRATWGFAVAFAIPLILFLKYQVAWLGMNYGSSAWTYGFILVLSAVITWLVWPALRSQRLLEWLDRQGPIIIFLAMVIYVVIYGGPKREVLIVPREALILTGEREMVVRALGDNRFQPVEVQTGMWQGDSVEVRSGLDVGDEVVLSGQFLIDSESNLQGSFRRMSE